MAIIDNIQGWQVEDGDFIILDSEEVEVTEVVSDDEGDLWVRYYSHSTGDDDTKPLDVYGNYEVWGE